MILQVGVKVLLKNQEDRFLLMRRSKEKYPEVNSRWDIPGGRIDPGISLLDNLMREVLEETGLQLVEEPRLIGAQDIMPSPEKHIVRLTYIGQAEGNVCLSEEHDEFGWFTFDELLHLDSLDHFLKELLTRHGHTETIAKLKTATAVT